MRSIHLQARIDRFSALQPDEPDALHAFKHIPSLLFERLQVATANYVMRSLPRVQWSGEMGDVVPAIDSEWGRIQTITAGGIVVPKRNTVLEYNLVLRAFSEIVEAIEIAEYVAEWHVPINIRVKYKTQPLGSKHSPRPSERAHSDAWAGEHPDSVTVHIPLLGDTSGNYVAIYQPHDDFDESWLVPTVSQDHAEIAQYETTLAKNYKELISERTALGEVLLLDAAMLHASRRTIHCGTRISLESPFTWINAPARDGLERAEEHAPQSVLAGIGNEYLLYFPDRVEDRVDSRGATKHPSNLLLKSL